jgi:hypothetical protein
MKSPVDPLLHADFFRPVNAFGSPSLLTDSLLAMDFLEFITGSETSQEDHFWERISEKHVGCLLILMLTEQIALNRMV